MKKLLFLCLMMCSVAFADESQIKLREGPGKDVTVANCQGCHSLDYIPMNSKFQERKGWEATVNKMMKSMGAPIRQEDVPIIIDYLTGEYGK